MHKIWSYILLSIFISHIAIAENKKLKNLNLVNIDGGYFYYGGYKTKQGELKFVPQFIISSHKVTNKEYRDMLAWCKGNNNDEAFNFLQINTKIKDKSILKYGIDENFIKIYLTSSKYDDYPVICTTYAQKIKYIELWSKKNELKCRLPHDYEIEFLLSSAECHNNNGDITTTQHRTFDEELKKTNDYDPSKYFNIGVLDDDKYKNKTKKTLNYTAYDQYQPNKRGVYDLMGNVFEQCIDDYSKNGKEKVLKGAAFYMPYNICKIENKYSINIKESSPFVGFRIVIEEPFIK